MCPANELGTFTISGKFRIRGLFRASFIFLEAAIKETFKQTTKFGKDTSDLQYALNAELDIKQINKG